MILLGHDFETTGVNVSSCGVVQSAIVIARMDDAGDGEILEEHTALWNPGCPIPPQATEVHGIGDMEVMDEMPYAEHLPEVYRSLQQKHQPEAFLGYNSKTFDDRIARRLGVRVPKSFDPIKLVRELKKRDGKLANAKLTTAYVHFTGKPAANAHDALADVEMTFELLPYLMEEFGYTSFRAFYEFATQPKIDPKMKMAFGKHKGVRIDKLDPGYVRWLMRQDIEDDLRYSIQKMRADRGE